MKKLSHILALVLALVMVLSLCAFASGEASGGASQEAASPKTPGETPAEVIMAALACRNFSDVPLTQEQIDAILAAGANAPSAMNGEP